MPRGRRPGDVVGPYRASGFVNPVRKARLAAGLTQAQLAVLAGVAERTVRNQESREVWPSGHGMGGTLVRDKLVAACEGAGPGGAGLGRSAETGN